MPFGLTIGTDRAAALQQSIQDELTKRKYSSEPDPVMAEYITIMIINNKTAPQITGELEDLIGSDYDPSFTDWLFSEAAKGAADNTSPAPSEPSTSQTAVEPTPAAPPAAANDQRRPRNNGIYQQALSQALPSTSPSGQKRSASARSPSPNHSNKIRRTDVPTGPRAMLRDGANPRSLLDRVGGPGGGQMRNNFGGQDDIQSHIDTIVNNPTAEQQQAMMMNASYPMGMDVNVMNGMANPMMLQEMMMNQMALMAQMASTMGIINPATGQFGGPAFGGMQGEMYPGGMDNNGFQGPIPHNGRGRGTHRGRGVGRGTGRPGSTSSPKPVSDTSAAPVELSAVPIAAPTPTAAPTGGIVGYILPERPQSPTLCKFGLKCTNAHCRYSHPSPVATAESGVVLSNEACEQGKECQDKDCIKAHVSPAVLNPQAASQPPPQPTAHHPPPAPHAPAGVPCRYGAACTRANCTFTHPPKPGSNPHFAQPCHFGAACTRANCLYQHPEGRVLPSTFHRGLSTSAPLVSVPTPETGSMGAAKHNRSVTFNQGVSVKEKLEQQMKEIEEKKSEAEKAVKAAEEAAASKKEKEAKAVAASA